MHTSHLILHRITFAALMAGIAFVAVSASGQVINEDLKLLASDGSTADWFGYSISIDSGVVAVGAIGDTNMGHTYDGAAYLYDASTGVQIAKLLASDGALGDNFGWSIAVNNGVVAVGSTGSSASGAAYLFNAFTGTQLAKLLPSDGAPTDRFGWSIAIANGLVAVGSFLDDDNGNDSGSAYVFDASTGLQIAKLLPIDGAAGDWFGYSIGIEGGIVVVGSKSDDDNGTDSGSAYLFNASTGAQIAKLLPGDGAADDAFGFSVSIHGGVVAVGAKNDNDNGSISGSAYTFDASTGEQIVKLLPGDGTAVDWFGVSIAINNGIVVVGSFFDDDNGSNSGSAYLFNASTGDQIVKILPGDGAAFDEFGFSVAIDNGIVAVGSRADDDNGSNSGSAYVFDINCPADINGDWAVDVLDFFAFVTAFGNNDMIADLDGSGALDVLDFFAFITFFAAGCP